MTVVPKNRNRAVWQRRFAFRGHCIAKAIEGDQPPQIEDICSIWVGKIHVLASSVEERDTSRETLCLCCVSEGKLMHDTMSIALSVVRWGKTYDSRSLLSGELSKHPAQALLLPYDLLIPLPRILLFQTRTKSDEFSSVPSEF